MDQKISFLVLLAAGLLCLNIIPICWAGESLEDGLQEDLDVEDELDPGFVGAEEEDDEDLEADLQDEAPPAPKTPPTPKVRLLIGLFPPDLSSVPCQIVLRPFAFASPVVSHRAVLEVVLLRPEQNSVPSSLGLTPNMCQNCCTRRKMTLLCQKIDTVKSASVTFDPNGTP